MPEVNFNFFGPSHGLIHRADVAIMNAGPIDGVFCEYVDLTSYLRTAYSAPFDWDASDALWDQYRRIYGWGILPKLAYIEDFDFDVSGMIHAPQHWIDAAPPGYSFGYPLLKFSDDLYFNLSDDEHRALGNYDHNGWNFDFVYSKNDPMHVDTTYGDIRLVVRGDMTLSSLAGNRAKIWLPEWFGCVATPIPAVMAAGHWLTVQII